MLKFVTGDKVRIGDEIVEVLGIRITRGQVPMYNVKFSDGEEHHVAYDSVEEVNRPAKKLVSNYPFYDGKGQLIPSEVS